MIICFDFQWGEGSQKDIITTSFHLLLDFEDKDTPRTQNIPDISRVHSLLFPPILHCTVFLFNWES